MMAEALAWTEDEALAFERAAKAECDCGVKTLHIDRMGPLSRVWTCFLHGLGAVERDRLLARRRMADRLRAEEQTGIYEPGDEQPKGTA